MARYYGNIGYCVMNETSPGVWEEQIIIRPYSGELVRNIRKLQSTDQLNDDINVANKISIISDPYANENFYNMRYVEFMGTKWKVSDVEVQYPRLILTLGGLYNDGGD